ncbi:MAG: hypothetical protein AB7O52_15815 [Planctomycetota bacterium]
MSWEPITLSALQAMLARDLAECSAEQQEFFGQTSISPSKWGLRPWGDLGGGFWVVAVHLDRVLWYNDIEDGFNVSRFDVQGEIPADEYWCNQDPLRWALPRLQAGLGTRPGPPDPL